MKPSTEQTSPSIKTTLPWDLNGIAAQLLPAETPLKTTVDAAVLHTASTNIPLQTTPTSLVVITANDYPVWWKWGTGCIGTTDNCHGMCPAEQTIVLVVPTGQTGISFRARTGTATVTISEY